MRDRTKKAIGWAARLLFTLPAISWWAIVIVLAVLGVISGLLWILSPAFRFAVSLAMFVTFSLMVVYSIRRFVTKDWRYLLGIFVGLVVILTSANAFLSVFPATNLPIATGSVVSAETKARMSDGFVLLSPIVLGAIIALPLASKYKKHEGLVVLGSVAISIALIWGALLVI